MIGIIDYGVGNLAGLGFALDDLNLDYFISSKPNQLMESEQVILPGVGNAQFAMNRLIELELVQFIKEWKKPLLGICLGMQLLYESSAESPIPLLSLIPGRLEQFDQAEFAKTHMGWNRLSSGELMYFVHSYFAPVNTYTETTTDYGIRFCSSVRKGLITGLQFHPEKSGKAGITLLSEKLKENALC